jgi:hypothetical protein
MKTSLKAFFVFLVCGLNILSVQSQSQSQSQSETNSTNITCESDRALLEFMPVSNGFVMLTEPAKRKGAKLEMEYNFYDEDLEFIRKVTTIESKYIPRTSRANVFSSGHLHSMYALSGKLHINSINYDNGSIISVNVKTGFKFGVFGETVVCGDKLVVLIYDSMSKSIWLQAVNYITGESEKLVYEIPNVKNDKSPIIGLRTLKSGGFLIGVVSKVKGNNYDTYFVRFNEQVEQTDLFRIENRFINKYEVSEMKNGNLVFSGMISNGSYSKSTGAFLSICSEGGKVEMDNKIPFTDVNGFMDYKPKEYKKGYRIGQVKTTVTANGIFMWGESYFYEINKDGYFQYIEYTHGFNAVFDLEGNLEGKNSFKTNYQVVSQSGVTGGLKQIQIKEGEYILTYRKGFPYENIRMGSSMFFVVYDDNSEIQPAGMEELDLSKGNLINKIGGKTFYNDEKLQLLFTEMDETKFMVIKIIKK